MAEVTPDLGSAVGPSLGGAAEIGGITSAGGLGAEVNLNPTGFEGMAPNLAPDVTNFTAGLDTTLDTTPNIGIQDVANVDVAAPAMPEVSADVPLPGAEAALVTEPPPGYKSPFAPRSPEPPSADSSPAIPAAEAIAAPEPAAPAETAVPEAAIPLSPTDQQELNDLLDKERREGLATDEHIRKAELANGPKADTEKLADTAAPDTIRVGEPNDIVASPDDVTAKGAEVAAPAATEAQATAEASADSDKPVRAQELEAKIKDKTATQDEIKELRGLKQDPEQRRTDLEQKALDGTITDQEAEELGNLNSSEAASNLTPEQQAEKLKQDVDELGAELMTKAANGQEITPEELAKLKSLSGQEALISRGFSAEDAKAAMGKAREAARGAKETAAMKEMQGKIQELMALEMQILSIPKSVDALREQREKAKAGAEAKHNELKTAASAEQRLRIRGEEANEYMKIANINGAIVGQKNLVPILEARIADTEQYIRRKVGVSSGFGALMEFGGAKVQVAAAQVRAEVGDEIDYRTGNY